MAVTRVKTDTMDHQSRKAGIGTLAVLFSQYALIALMILTAVALRFAAK
jgi:hypothetical protein